MDTEPWYLQSTRSNVNIRILLSCLVAVAAISIQGCQKDSGTVPVDGQVVFRDGSTLDHGIIVIKHKTLPHVARGEIGEQGEFSLSTFRPGDGAIPGEYQVAVTQLIIAEDLKFEDHKHGKRIDPKYSRIESSGLGVTIRPGESNHLKIEVDSPPEDSQ